MTTWGVLSSDDTRGGVVVGRQHGGVWSSDDNMGEVDFFWSKSKKSTRNSGETGLVLLYVSNRKFENRKNFVDLIPPCCRRTTTPPCCRSTTTPPLSSDDPPSVAIPHFDYMSKNVPRENDLKGHKWPAAGFWYRRSGRGLAASCFSGPYGPS